MIFVLEVCLEKVAMSPSSLSKRHWAFDMKDIQPISLVGGVSKIVFFLISQFISKSTNLKGAPPNYTKSITKSA
jgi:hypothetical protein